MPRFHLEFYFRILIRKYVLNYVCDEWTSVSFCSTKNLLCISFCAEMRVGVCNHYYYYSYTESEEMRIVEVLLRVRMHLTAIDKHTQQSTNPQIELHRSSKHFHQIFFCNFVLFSRSSFVRLLLLLI